MHETKACRRCLVEKKIDDFWPKKRRSGKVGVSSVCKPCDRQRAREWRARNEERVRQNSAAYRAAIGKDILRKKNIEQYQKNKEARKAYAAEYREKNPDRCRVWREKWKNNNLEKWAEMRRVNSISSEHKRRCWMRGSAQKFSLKLRIAELLKLQRGKCGCCRKKLVSYHVDHIKPISGGGFHISSNLQLLCPPCNQHKSSKDPIDFMQSKGLLL
jgi:5-methylcytosine-specific restriction endonuclease McrA